MCGKMMDEVGVIRGGGYRGQAENSVWVGVGQGCA